MHRERERQCGCYSSVVRTSIQCRGYVLHNIHCMERGEKEESTLINVRTVSKKFTLQYSPKGQTDNNARFLNR